MTETHTEEELLAELEILCQSEGYIHVLAKIAFNFTYDTGKEITFSIREIELNILIYLTFFTHKVKNTKNITEERINTYLYNTENILEKIHNLYKEDKRKKCILREYKEATTYSDANKNFYQSIELSKEKYKDDEEWLLENKGYSLNDATIVLESLKKYSLEQTKYKNEHLNILEKLTFSLEDILDIVKDKFGTEKNITKKTLENIIQSFSFKPTSTNNTLKSITDYVPTLATPIISLEKNKFFLPSTQSLYFALFDTPYYWMVKDTKYKDRAGKNRGKYLERYVEKKLIYIFGKENVFSNIQIKEKNTKVLSSEIDILVIYAKRILIFECKAKRITLETKQGDVEALKKDYEESIKKANEQLQTISNLIKNSNYQLFFSDNKKFELERNPIEVYLFSIVEYIPHPYLFSLTQERKLDIFVLDIFTFDALTSILNKPLFLFDYLSKYSNKRENIPVISIAKYIHNSLKDIAPDIESLLVNAFDDLLRYVKKMELPKNKEDLLQTTFETYLNKKFQHLIQQLGYLAKEHTVAFDIGKIILSLPENERLNLCSPFKRKADYTKENPKNIILRLDSHAVFIYWIDDHQGIVKDISDHIKRRAKDYDTTTCFGVCINNSNNQIQNILVYNSIDGKEAIDSLKFSKQKRNEQCYCGSGKKYKKCCMPKQQHT